MPKLYNLWSYTLQELRELMLENNLPGFRSQQIFSWLYQKNCRHFDQMSNLGQATIAWLKNNATLQLPKITTVLPSNDGTIKFLMTLSCGNVIESVYIPADNRGTLCISSQAGCALKCTFCLTGQQGFSRNMTTDEIIGQFILVSDYLREHDVDQAITNVVFMGMGEPLLNEDNVYRVCDILLDDKAAGLSKYKVTVSTSGIIPAIERMKLHTDVAFTLSLHAPNNPLRNELVPINKKYPLEQLMPVVSRYFAEQPRRKVNIAYIMLNQVNDQPHHAKELVALLANIRCKVNLIPFNLIPNVPYKTSSDETILRFQKLLSQQNIQTNIRWSRGDDVGAACGQLDGHVMRRSKHSIHQESNTDS